MNNFNLIAKVHIKVLMLVTSYLLNPSKLSYSTLSIIFELWSLVSYKLMLSSSIIRKYLPVFTLNGMKTHVEFMN